MSRKIDMEHLTQLARLRLSPEEAEKLGEDLEQMAANIESLSHIPEEWLAEAPDEFGSKTETAASADARQWLRPDVPEPSLPREALLRNAPDSDGEYFVVPRTIGGQKG